MKKLIILCLIAIFGVQPVSAIDAENITAQDKIEIRKNCKDAQQTMQRIQYVDPVARVNRGTAYNNITKLMTALTARSAFNAYSIPQFSIETDAVQNLRTQFAKDYTEYEIALRELINFDCQDEPEEFYKRLVDVRSKRAIVTLRVREIDRRLDVYATNVGQLGELIKAKDIGQ